MDCVVFADPRSSQQRSPKRAPLVEIGPNAPMATLGPLDMTLDLAEDLVQPVLHIEARMKADSQIRFHQIRFVLHSYVVDNYSSLCQETFLQDWQDVDLLDQHLEQVRVAECPALAQEVILLDQVELQIHVYQSASISDATLFTAGSDEQMDGSSTEEEVQAASITELPNALLDGLWANLCYDNGIKENLLNFISSTMAFSQADIDFNVVSYNRMALLHGPPGSGKTSLAKALAQKLSIRLANTFSYGKIVEINAHSLFSKWFSESGKLVQRLFAGILELVEDESAFVVVLIDEVESLTSARAGAISGKEPSDALRVVNALLTNLDKLKTKKNVLVITTSNLSHAIDPAFVDRADIKQYVGLPSQEAIYWILSSCLNELHAKNLLASPGLLDWKALALHRSTADLQKASTKTDDLSEKQQAQLKLQAQKQAASLQLHELAGLCWTNKMSGRFLRRLPILAHAKHLVARQSSRLPVATWISAMARAVQEEVEQMELVASGGV